MNSVKSGRQRCTQSLHLLPRPPLSPVPNLVDFQLQAVKCYFSLLQLHFSVLCLHYLSHSVVPSPTPALPISFLLTIYSIALITLNSFLPWGIPVELFCL